MRSVQDGMYFADQNATYFMAGQNPVDAVLIRKADYGAIPGTDVRIDAETIGDGSMTGRLIVWVSPQGICIGGNEGKFANLTKTNYHVSGQQMGTGIIRDLGGYFQYLASMWN